MLSKFPKSQKTWENAGPEANREKTTMKLTHIDLEAILEPFWPHLEVLGKPLGAILGILGRVYPKRAQDTLIIAAGWPTLAYLGPSCSHFGPKLGPTWLKLGPCWAQIRVPSRP